jgi:biopolymer transport protein ExbB
MSRTRRLQIMGAIILLCLGGLWAVSLAAAPEAAAGAGKDAVQVQTLTLRDIVAQGGALMYVMGLMSVLGVALVIYFFVILRRQQVVPESLRRDVMAKIEAGNLDEARAACSYRPCAFAEIALVALDFVRARGAAEPALLKDVLEGEGSRQATAIQTQTQYLLDIGVIAPMVGLLGTVFGMVHAFGVVAVDLAKAKPMLLAAGVSEALVNTAGGLIVGIPAMMFYAYFRGRASKLLSHLEAASMDLLTALVRKSNP